MKRTKKICHITSAHADGDVRIFHKECVGLAEAGYEVVHIVPNTQERVEKGVQIKSFQFVPTSRINRFRKSVDLVYQKALEVDADAYHLHDPELLRVALKLKRKGKIVVYDAHEDLPRQILAKKYLKPAIRKTLSQVMERYENKKAKKLDAIVTATPYIRDRFLKVNSNSIDINNFPIIDELLLDQQYSSKEGDNICYVGGITTVRGIKELVDSLPDTSVKLLLAGEILEDGLRESLELKQGWKQVEELGFLSRQGVKEVYLQSKLGMVTLHPILNYVDALPVKMFEYMAAGIPVIASDFPLWKGIIEEANCGICVDPMNPKEIAKNINYILTHPKEAGEMGKNGKNAVLTKYNWQIEKEKLVQLYNRLFQLN